MSALPKLKQETKQKVLIYCRVSSTKQKTEGHGLDSQEHRCRQYAAVRGYEVEKVFPDDASGGGDFMNRPGMVSLLHYLDQNRGTHYVVLFDDLKRFARDREFHFKLKEALTFRKATVECLNFRFEDTPENEFIEAIFAAQGQLERQQNKRQVIQKMKARLEQGYNVFQAPPGYVYKKVPEHGKLMVRDEPMASIIQEALEGYASGRFQMQAEVQRFLEKNPYYPSKDKQGRVHPSRVKEMLTNPMYAGYVGKKDWAVSMRKGQHEPLVSLETFEKIQERLTKKAKAPARKDIREDFPLRGFILCDCCQRPLTSGWAKGKRKKHPYYFCYHKGCEMYGKTIRRDKLEGDFEDLLKTLQPAQGIFVLAKTMFKDGWDQQINVMESMVQGAKQKLASIEQDIQRTVDRIMTASTPAVITRYEERIEQLEKEKRLLADTQDKPPVQHGSFEE